MSSFQGRPYREVLHYIYMYPDFLPDSGFEHCLLRDSWNYVHPRRPLTVPRLALQTVPTLNEGSYVEARFLIHLPQQRVSVCILSLCVCVCVCVCVRVCVCVCVSHMHHTHNTHSHVTHTHKVTDTKLINHLPP